MFFVCHPPIKRGISYIPWCIASYYIIKLPNARDPNSSTGTRQLNNIGKRRVSPMKPSVPLLCWSFYDFRFTPANISFVKSKGVFCPSILTNLPSDHKVVYADAPWSYSEQDLCFSASCYKALRGFTSLPPACLEMNICCFCTLFFMFLVCDRGAHCQFNNSSTQWIH